MRRNLMGALITSMSLILPGCTGEKREPTGKPSKTDTEKITRETPQQVFDKYNGIPESDLEKKIQNLYGIDIKGLAQDDPLAVINGALQNLPIIDPCKVYILPPKDFEHLKHLFDEPRIAGAYFSPKHPLGERILFFTPMLPSTVTHEWAHKRTDVLGEKYTKRWISFNKHPYGEQIHRDEQGVYRWKDDNSTGPRYGFCQPYGRKNALEDIATLTEWVRHEVYKTATIGVEDRYVLARKINLLAEGQFISPEESKSSKEVLYPKKGKIKIE